MIVLWNMHKKPVLFIYILYQPNKQNFMSEKMLIFFGEIFPQVCLPKIKFHHYISPLPYVYNFCSIHKRCFYSDECPVSLDLYYYYHDEMAKRKGYDIIFYSKKTIVAHAVVSFPHIEKMMRIYTEFFFLLHEIPMDSLQYNIDIAYKHRKLYNSMKVW